MMQTDLINRNDLLSREMTLDLPPELMERIYALKKQGEFDSEQAVVEAGLQALSRDQQQLQDEKAYLEELAKLTHLRTHDLG